MPDIKVSGNDNFTVGRDYYRLENHYHVTPGNQPQPNARGSHPYWFLHACFGASLAGLLFQLAVSGLMEGRVEAVINVLFIALGFGLGARWVNQIRPILKKLW